MSLVLDKKEIYEILSKRNFIKSRKELLEILKITKNNFLKFTKNCENLKYDKELNPFMWQVGHVIYFFDNLILKNLKKCERLNEDKFDNNYDSFITGLKYRDYKRFDYNSFLVYFNKIVNILESYISNNLISNIESYLITLGVLHTEMHNEAFIFSRLKISNELFFKIDSYDDNLINHIDFIKYSGGLFNQGASDDTDYLNFDNEMPSFNKKLKIFVLVSILLQNIYFYNL